MVQKTIEVQVEGLEAVRQVFEQLRLKTPHAVAAALNVEGEKIMTSSKQTYVPVDTGALKASGHVKPPEISGGEISVVLAYGGPAASYALWVHEIPPPPEKSWSGRSARHEPPTQWKYLETPAKAAIPGMDERLAAEMRKELP